MLKFNTIGLVGMVGRIGVWACGRVGVWACGRNPKT
jgi:hypothetical protein